MAIQVHDRTIEQILIVDDDENARSGYSFLVEDLELKPILEDGPISDLQRFVNRAVNQSDAAICDHHLRVGNNYASFNGAELVANLYKNQLPALLCTRLEKADILEIRHYRQHIPVLLNPAELEIDPENIFRGFEICAAEIAGTFNPDRRPWRTLVRVEDVETEANVRSLLAILPGWNPNQGIRLRFSDVPSHIHACLVAGARLHARVNIGAESQEDLYFCDWEID